MPANDVRRDFIADGKKHGGRMPAQPCDVRRYFAPDFAGETPIVKEGDVLRPRKPDHKLEIVFRRGVEQIVMRDRVSTDGIESRVPHLPEVFPDLRDRRKLIT